MRTEINKYFVLFLVMSASLILSSCAPVYKANIDYEMTGGILWPGVPEKPRIKYLWNIYSLAPVIPIADFFAGGGDISDPKTSLTLLNPYGIYYENDRLYIADTSAMRATVINIKTMDVLQIGVDGKGELNYPVGIVSDNAGNIYVTDSELNRVMLYDRDGKFIGKFSNIAFKRPTGIAYDKTKNLVYVVDTLEHRVYGIGTEGNLRISFGTRGIGNGEFNYPTHIAVDKEGKIYISDAMNFRIQCFDGNGKYILQLGTIGDTYDKFSLIKGVASDSEGNVYVVDSGQDMVKIFNRDGKLLLFFGEKGAEKGRFWMPSGIFIDRDDKIYIADTYNQRVQVFQFLGGK